MAAGVMTTFSYKGLTRNPDIGNSPFRVLPTIWRQGRVRDTKFGTNVSNNMLLNAPKYQVTAKRQRGKINPLPSTQIRIKRLLHKNWVVPRFTS